MHLIISLFLLLQVNSTGLQKITEITEIGDHFLSGIRNIEIIDDKIIIANGDQHQILISDLEGNYLHSFGKEGSGPGEFRGMNQMTTSRDSAVVIVWDQNLSRLSAFDLEGNMLNSESLKGRYMGMVTDENMNVYLSVLDLAGGNKLVKKMRFGNGIVNEFMEPDRFTTSVHRSGNAGDITYSYSDKLMYYASAFPYKITGINEQGEIRFSFENEHPDFAPPSAGGASGGYHLGGNLPARISSILEKDGQLWVQYQTEKGNFLDVISIKEPEIIKTVELPESHRLGFLHTNYLYTYSVGRSTEAKIVKWKVD